MTAKSLRAKAVPKAKDAELKLLSLAWCTRVVPYVVSAGAFVQQPVVVNLRALVDHDFGHCVGEVAWPRGTGVGFDHGEVGIAPGEDERAGMAGVPLVIVRVAEAAMVDADRDRDVAVVRNADYGYVAEERCVQRGKTVVKGCETAEMLAYLILVTIERRERRDRRETKINLCILRALCG